jgi:hypothetical protein
LGSGWLDPPPRRWMNGVGPLGRPVLFCNQDAVMARGGTGLARYLEAGAA